MEIIRLDLFDLYGDGTLVMKTEVDEPDPSLRYAWYVKAYGQKIYETHYQRNPFTAAQLQHLGSYVVKAFVRDGEGNKVTLEKTFTANKYTSPQLALTDTSFTVTPVATQISGAFWQFTAEGTFGENTRFAWYVYQEGADTPIEKIPYSKDPSTVYQFTAPGRYYVKAFVIQDGVKQSASCVPFTVTM